MARGGNKTTPRNPAAVSGPGAAARRTDGGPGSATQPLRAPTGQPYGERQALVNQQRAVPLAATATPPNASAARGAGTSDIRMSGAPGGIFGATQRPHEPPTAGLPSTSETPYDVDDALRMLYSIFPHPQLLSLLRR